MQGTEKRTNVVSVKMEDSLFIAIAKLAAMEDRTVADYMHRIASIHVYGHAPILSACSSQSNKSNSNE
jgi:hypothetical protein